MFGRSIKIFLSDGSSTGLRHVEIANWSGQAIACPRSRFAELSTWEEAQRPGVYFLLEKHTTDGKNTVYIGESENVFKRLVQHDRNKDFWNEVIIFTSKDENLTKSHIKYLEARLTAITIEVDRYNIENGNIPPESSLPKSDVAAMEEYIHNLRLILGTLGHRLLEPILSSVRSSNLKTGEQDDNEFIFVVNSIKAIGKQSDEGFIILKGSDVSIGTTVSLPGKMDILRNKLIEQQILIENNKKYSLQKDIIVSSSSYAAAFVAGTSRSGPQSWKNKAGKTLKQVEEQMIGNNKENGS